jgi:hypothetical protein
MAIQMVRGRSCRDDLLSLWNWRGTIGDNKQKKKKKNHTDGISSPVVSFSSIAQLFLFFLFRRDSEMRKKIFLFFNFLNYFQWTKGKEKQQTFRHLSVQQSSKHQPNKTHKIFGPVCVCLRENAATTDDDDVQIGARRQQQLTPTTLGREHFRTNI